MIKVISHIKWRKTMLSRELITEKWRVVSPSLPKKSALKFAIFAVQPDTCYQLNPAMASLMLAVNVLHASKRYPKI
uniref:KH domain-containing protein At5g56140 n=1 Tax=Rhizophora mucronata TaxID=61149 RepID=A0A2P2LYB3_RHIMU